MVAVQSRNRKTIDLGKDVVPGRSTLPAEAASKTATSEASTSTIVITVVVSIAAAVTASIAAAVVTTVIVAIITSIAAAVTPSIVTAVTTSIVTNAIVAIFTGFLSLSKSFATLWSGCFEFLCVIWLDLTVDCPPKSDNATDVGMKKPTHHDCILHLDGTILILASVH